MFALLLLLYATSNLGSNACAKLNSGMLLGASRAKYSFYLVIIGIMACVFFWTLGGFSIGLNIPTLVFACFYAAVAAASTILRMIAFRLSSVSGVNIIMSGCSLLCSLGIGILLFSENITLLKLIRVALMLISISLIFFETKKNESGDEIEKGKVGKNSVKLIIVLALIVLASCADIIILKLFTLDTRVLDDNSFFFWTNVVLVVGCMLVVFYDTVIRQSGNQDIGGLFKPRALAGIAGCAFSFNVTSIVSLGLIALVDVSVYTPVTAALAVISGTVASLLFKEKLGVFSYLAVLAALVAVII